MSILRERVDSAHPYIQTQHSKHTNAEIDCPALSPYSCRCSACGGSLNMVPYIYCTLSTNTVPYIYTLHVRCS